MMDRVCEVGDGVLRVGGLLYLDLELLKNTKPRE